MTWSYLLAILFCVWIFLPSLLLVFPMPNHWLKSRKRRPKEGDRILIRNIPGQWYESANSRSAIQNAVLIVHGRSRSRGFMEPLALALREEFNVLTFDLRHHGERGYGSVTYGILESSDVHTALDDLKNRGITRIAVVGISMGAAAAAKALSEIPYPEVRALALIGPVASAPAVVDQFAPRFGLPGFLKPLIILLGGIFASQDLRKADTAAWLAKLTQLPKALLTGDHDEVLGMGHSRILQKAIFFDFSATYPGGHDEPGNPELQKLLISWLKEKLFSQ